MTEVLDYTDNIRSARHGVPEGFYLADEQEQIAAIAIMYRLAERLIAEHPEVADLYRDTVTLLTYYFIAK